MSCFGCCSEDNMQKTAANGPYMTHHTSGNNGAYRSRETVLKGTQIINVQPISVSALQVDELKDITDNFGTKALIGEGSYGRVYHDILKTGQAAAIKKLDTSKKPDQEFLAQALGFEMPYFAHVSLILAPNKSKL